MTCLWAKSDQGSLKGNDRSLQDLGFVAQVEPKVERDLIVAAAGRVQLGPGRSNPPGQLRFDIHVHVLELRIKNKAAVVDLFLDYAQGALDAARTPPRREFLLSARPERERCCRECLGDKAASRRILIRCMF